MIESGSGMSSRATAFVILGICIGALIRLAQSIFIEAWLTVLDGYRAGRVLVLSQPVTKLGRAEYLPLPFLGEMSKELELEHASITRQGNGRFVIEDNKTRSGTRVGGQLIQGPVTLKNGDIIKLATNFIRFNERQSQSGETGNSSSPAPVVKVMSAPPPPPKMPGATPAAPARPGAPQSAPISPPKVSDAVRPPAPPLPPTRPAGIPPRPAGVSSAPLPPPAAPRPMQPPPAAKLPGAPPPPAPTGGSIRPVSPPPPPPKKPGAN